MDNLRNLIKNSIELYELKAQIRNIDKKSSKDKTLTTNTISIFKAYRGEKYATVFKQLKPILYGIRKYDEVILFENKKIFKHTYLILFYIQQYLDALDFYHSREYKNSFAALRGDKRKFLRKYSNFRKEVFDIYTEVPGAKRLKAVIFKAYAKNREFSDIFLNFYTMYPPHQFKYGDDEIWTKKIIEKIWFYFSSTPIHSEEIIHKSLAIVLNAYFKHRMSMKSGNSIRFTTDILYELFGYEFNATSADLLHKVYITGRIAGMPIFKNRAKGEIFSKKIIEQYNHFFKVKLPEEFPEVDFEPYMIDAENFFEKFPLTAFFNLYPMEFLHPVE
ncbi:hypothetical protein [Hydrogenimonas sp.]